MRRSANSKKTAQVLHTTILYSNASALSQSLLTLRAGVVQDLALF